MKKYSWSFSENETLYHHLGDSIEDCISQAKDWAGDMKDPYSHVYIGENIPYNAYIDTHMIIDSLSEQAYEECGEAAEGWLSVEGHKIDVLNGMLQEALDKWLDSIGEVPTFYQVDNLKSYDLQ